MAVHVRPSSSAENFLGLCSCLQLEAPQLWGKNHMFLLLVGWEHQLLPSCSYRLSSSHIGSLGVSLVCFCLWVLRYTRNKPSVRARKTYDSNGSYLGDRNIFVDFLPHQWQFLNFPWKAAWFLMYSLLEEKSSNKPVNNIRMKIIFLFLSCLGRRYFIHG